MEPPRTDAAPPLETFLFDLDGTLVDSVELILASYRHTFAAHLGASPSDEEILPGLGTPLWAHLGKYVEDAAEVEAMVATYRAFNLERHDELIGIYAGANELVAGLAERGARLGIVTSKSRPSAERALRVCGLPEVFEVLITPEDTDAHKPDPAPVLCALERLAAEARGAVYVGDSPHDLRAGRRAGTRTAAALWGPFPRPLLEPEGPDHWLESPTDVLALVGGAPAQADFS